MPDKPENNQDTQLFLDTIGKVIPVNSDKRSIVPTQKPKPYPQKKSPFSADKLTLAQTNPVTTLLAEDTLSYTAPGLQKNILKKMRRGHFGLDAERDLHGLTSAEARRELIKFLHFCVQDGYRCVRIIHGKGYRSESLLPVLKNDINLWLRQHQDVQAFCSAGQKEGGAGAVFVLLRLSGKYTDQNDSQY